MAKKTIGFEEQMEELKTITRSLESGQLSLDDSLKLFEKGIGLYRSCSQTLEVTERKVSALLEDNSLRTMTDMEDGE